MGHPDFDFAAGGHRNVNKLFDEKEIAYCSKVSDMFSKFCRRLINFGCGLFFNRKNIVQLNTGTFCKKLFFQFSVSHGNDFYLKKLLSYQRSVILVLNFVFIFIFKKKKPYDPSYSFFPTFDSHKLLSVMDFQCTFKQTHDHCAGTASEFAIPVFRYSILIFSFHRSLHRKVYAFTFFSLAGVQFFHAKSQKMCACPNPYLESISKRN